MLVDDIVGEQSAEGWRLSATVHSAPAVNGERLHFTVHGAAPEWFTVTGDAFLAALLMPAMALGEELVIEAPVSPRLHRSARTVMDIYTAWWGDRHRVVPLRCAAPVPPVRHAGSGSVGLYFTGGVDSFYSLLKDVELSTDAEHEPVTHLLYANFERHHGRAYERLLGRLRRAATAYVPHAVSVVILARNGQLDGTGGGHGRRVAGGCVVGDDEFPGPQ